MKSRSIWAMKWMRSLRSTFATAVAIETSKSYIVAGFSCLTESCIPASELI
jgi:hypothetical protein